MHTQRRKSSVMPGNQRLSEHENTSAESGKVVPSSAVSGYSDGFRERLQEVIDSVGSLGQAGAIAGVSDEQLGKWRDGKSKPSFFGLGALCQAAGRSLDWLIGGLNFDDPDAVMAHVQGAIDEVDRAGAGVERALKNFAMLPRYNVQASAGNGLVAHDEGEVERIAFRLDWLREIGLDPRQAGLVTAQGDSMYPTIPDGALMLVDHRTEQAIRSGFVYVIVLAGEVLVKRLSRNVDGTIDLISDNAIYPVQKVTQADFGQLMIAGRVFWVGKKL